MAETQIGYLLYHQIQINGERSTTNVNVCLTSEQNPNGGKINYSFVFKKQE